LTICRKETEMETQTLDETLGRIFHCVDCCQADCNQIDQTTKGLQKMNSRLWTRTGIWSWNHRHKHACQPDSMFLSMCIGMFIIMVLSFKHDRQTAFRHVMLMSMFTRRISGRLQACLLAYACFHACLQVVPRWASGGSFKRKVPTSQRTEFAYCPVYVIASLRFGTFVYC